MFQVLVTDDQPNTRKLLETVLHRAGYEVFTAQDGQEALRVLDEQHIDILLLDIMMPGMDGYALTRELRENGNNTPILMITAKQLPDDKHKGFLAGADDYITKPVDMEEMLLRIRALLRRSQIINEHRLQLGEVVLEYDTLTVSRGEDRQTLPQKEFYLLYKLLSFPNQIFTRIQLMDEIWGMESESGDTTVNVHINRLRRRFENHPEFELVAVWGLGYKAVKRV
ncbi:MAG: response regulator transcription factor [Eubacteriales bacterium]|nr:response regulator transcription factor [Eubacteriales bacterium]